MKNSMGFIFGVGVFVFCFQSWGANNYLKQTPKHYLNNSQYSKASKCQGLQSQIKAKLLEMRKQGHKLVLALTTGSFFDFETYPLKDTFNGVTYLDANKYLKAMESYIVEQGPISKQHVIKEMQNCFKGKPQWNKRLKQSCLQNKKVKYFHIGLVVLDRRYSKEPFVVHFYGDEKYNFNKPAVRVETFDSYFMDSRNTNCDLTLQTMTASTQNRVLEFLNGGHGEKLLTPGKSSYNIFSHPWGLRTQNCNKWVAQLMATSLFQPKKYWQLGSVVLARDTLIETGFRPIKVRMKTWQNIGSMPASIIGGVNAFEGNIHHEYGVADVLPAEAVTYWLKRQKKLGREYYLRGQM